MASPESSAKWRQKTKDRVAAYARDWRAKNPGQRQRYANTRSAEAQHDSSLRARYGFGRDIYLLLLDWQDGRCAICGADECRTGRRLAVDHCHKTGRIRGVLCGDCNVALGRLQDDPVRALAAANYLTRTSA